jgi:hypothetical protein
MKATFYTLFLAAILLTSCSGRAGNKAARNAGNLADSTATAVIVFKEYEHHFGTVKEGDKLSYTFSFDNKGTGSLVILDAITTCGCTVPKYDRKPIPSGKGGKLEVKFDTSGRDGMQTKTITVRSNATVPAVILKITADVVKKN